MLGVFQRQGSGYYVVIFEVRVGLCVQDVSSGRVRLGELFLARGVVGLVLVFVSMDMWGRVMVVTLGAPQREGLGYYVGDLIVGYVLAYVGGRCFWAEGSRGRCGGGSDRYEGDSERYVGNGEI